MDYTFWVPLLVTFTISMLTLFWNLMQERSIGKLNSEIQKSLFIHKIQFEKEFEVYENLWQAIVNFEECTRNLRPYPGSFGNETAREKLASWNTVGLALHNQYKGQRPFYHHTIYSKLEELLKIGRIEQVYFELETDGNKETSNKRLDDILKKEDELTKCCNELSDLIRKRIDSINVRS